MKKIFILLLFIVLLGGAVGAFIYQSSVKSKNIAEVENELFIPYFKKINDREFSQAWGTFTTDEYKRTHSLEAYQAHWNHIFQTQGQVQRHTVQLFNKGIALDGAQTAEVRLFVYTDTQKQTIAYTLQRNAQGKYQINGAANRTLTTKAEPW